MPEKQLRKFEAMFEEAAGSLAPMYELDDRDENYYHGNQLTAPELAELKKRGQPEVIINRIRRKINLLKGVEINSRTRPKGEPRHPKVDPQGAEAVADAVNYVIKYNKWRKLKTLCYESFLLSGKMVVEVLHEPREDGNPRVVINYYRRDRFFFDPHSVEQDFSDARFLGAVIWEDGEALVKQHPELKDRVDVLMHEAAIGEVFQDKPSMSLWADAERKRVCVVLLHYKNDEDEWHWAKYVKGKIIEEGASGYVDPEGHSVCPMIAQSLYVNLDNHRYGVVRDMVGPQDEINKRRSRLMHLLNNRQHYVEKGAVPDIKKFKRETAHADGVLEINPGYWDKVKPSDMTDLANGHVTLLQEAKNEIDLMGINPILAGQGREAQGSGRNTLANQQGALVEIADVMEGVSQFNLNVWTAVWYRIKQFWTAEEWVRVTKDERNTRFVGLNVRKTLGEYLLEIDPRYAQMLIETLQIEGPDDPRLQEASYIHNNVQELDVDIDLDEVPDNSTLVQETWQAMVELAGSQPGTVPFELLVEAAPQLRTEMKDRIIQGIIEQRQQQQEMQERALALEEKKTELEFEHLSMGSEQRAASAVKMLAQAGQIQKTPIVPKAVGGGGT
jgi:hypothetical protein